MCQFQVKEAQKLKKSKLGNLRNRPNYTKKTTTSLKYANRDEREGPEI